MTYYKIRLIRVMGIVSLAVLVGISAFLVGAAQAQENATDRAEEELTESEEEAEEIEEQIDSNIDLLEIEERSDGGMILTFRAEEPAYVQVVERSDAPLGTDRYQIEMQQVTDRTTIQIDASEAAITTEETVQEGYGVTVSTSTERSLPTTSLGYGVAVGIVTMTGGIGIAAWRIRAVEHQQIESGWSE